MVRWSDSCYNTLLTWNSDSTRLSPRPRHPNQTFRALDTLAEASCSEPLQHQASMAKPARIVRTIFVRSYHHKMLDWTIEKKVRLVGPTSSIPARKSVELDAWNRFESIDSLLELNTNNQHWISTLHDSWSPYWPLFLPQSWWNLFSFKHHLSTYTT